MQCEHSTSFQRKFPVVDLSMALVRDIHVLMELVASQCLAHVPLVYLLPSKNLGQYQSAPRTTAHFHPSQWATLLAQPPGSPSSWTAGALAYVRYSCRVAVLVEKAKSLLHGNCTEHMARCRRVAVSPRSSTSGDYEYVSG
jgi:hypothetical protein